MENFSEEYLLSALETLSEAQEASISELNRLFPACLEHAVHGRLIPLNRFTAVAERTFKNVRKAIVFLSASTVYFRADGSTRVRRGQEAFFRTQVNAWLESRETFAGLCARQAQTAKEEARAMRLAKAVEEAQANAAVVRDAAAKAVEALVKRFPQHEALLQTLATQCRG